MHWTKVTPETLPPDGEAVMVTIKEPRTGWKFVKYNVKYGYCTWRFGQGKVWQEMAEGYEYIPILDCYEVTHWTPMPAPAEDD